MAEPKKVSGNLPAQAHAIMTEITDERARQVGLGYGLDHDDEYGVEHLAVEADRRLRFSASHTTDEQARARLVRAAALVVAAIETIDRRADSLDTPNRVDLNDLSAKRRAQASGCS